MKLNGRWAIAWDKCQICGTTERRHCAKGRCERCYQRDDKRLRFRDDPAWRGRILENKRRWWRKIGPERRRKIKDRINAWKRDRPVDILSEGGGIAAFGRAVGNPRKQKGEWGYLIIIASGVVFAPVRKMRPIGWKLGNRTLQK
jgi:hypothetical protein